MVWRLVRGRRAAASSSCRWPPSAATRTWSGACPTTGGRRGCSGTRRRVPLEEGPAAHDRLAAGGDGAGPACCDPRRRPRLQRGGQRRRRLLQGIARAPRPLGVPLPHRRRRRRLHATAPRELCRRPPAPATAGRPSCRHDAQPGTGGRLPDRLPPRAAGRRTRWTSSSPWRATRPATRASCRGCCTACGRRATTSCSRPATCTAAASWAPGCTASASATSPTAS